MADDFIRVGAEGTGKRMDAESFIRGAATTIYRERVQVGGSSDSDVVVATTAAPAAAAVALAVRVAGSVQVSGAVSVSAMPAVSGTLTVQGAVTVQTQLGTQVVSVVPGVSVTVQQGVSVSAQVSGTVTNVPLYSTTAAPAVAATGGIVWVANPGAAVATTVLTVQTILGTAVVSVVPGVSVTIQQGASVSAVVSGTITAIPADRTTAVPSASATGQVMWIAGGQSTTAFPVVVTGTVTAGAGTTVVSVTGSVTVVAGLSVSAVVSGTVTVNGSVALSGTGLVSVVPGLSVSAVVSGTVSNVGLLFTTGVATVASTGQIVVPKDFVRPPVVIIVSSTVVGSSTTMLMTIYTGATLVTTGTSAWPVPAGKVFRVMNMNIVAVSSAVLGQARFVVIVGTAAVSVSVVATVGIAAVLPFAIEASTAPFALGAYLADIEGATTVGVGIQGGTSCSILGAVVSGYLF